MQASTTLLCVYGPHDRLAGRGATVSGDPLRNALMRLAPLDENRTCNANFDSLAAVVRIDGATRNDIVVDLSGCASALLPHGDRLFFQRTDDIAVSRLFAKAR